MTISVLMSTYIKEQPNYLDEAMRSIWTEQKKSLTKLCWWRMDL